MMLARILGLSLITWLVVLTVLYALRKLIIVRILAVSVVTGVSVALILLALCEPPVRDFSPVIFLGAVGMIVGAIAGAAREIVAAQRRKPPIVFDAEF